MPDLMLKGVITALGAFFLWGFSPLYYRAAGAASAYEILAHRAVWSLLFLLIILLVRGQLASTLQVIRHGRILLALLLSSILVSVNWLLFIWAVNNNQALEASMGYFIMPLVMVVLGRIFLGERLSTKRWIAFLLALTGVLNLLLVNAALPWIALSLATSFGLYSLVRKKTPVGAVAGLAIECLLLLPIALTYLIYLNQTDTLAFRNISISMDLLLIGTALMTAVPLILFTTAGKLLPLGTLGMLQYINPTLQFLLAVFLFQESFTQTHMITFVLIWAGLLLFSWDSVKSSRPSPDEYPSGEKE